MDDPVPGSMERELWQRFRNCFESGLAEDFLQILLALMAVMFGLDRDYRRNIDRFSGRYQFRSEDGRIRVAALFADGRMQVVEGEIEDPHITVIFRNSRSLLNFLISPRQDILGAMLRHEVRTEGNLNYLNKFGYMAKHLQLMMPRR